MLTSKTELLARGRRLKTVDLPIPEWSPAGEGEEPTEVRLLELTGRIRDDFADSISGGPKGERTLKNFTARLVSLSLVDENNNRLFSELEIKELGETGCAGLRRIYDAACKLNRFEKDEVDDLTKNSEAGPGESSS